MAALEYVSLIELKNWMQIQHTAMDDKLEMAIMGFSNAVKNYLKDFSAYEGQRNEDDDYVLDSNYEPEIQLDANNDRVVKAEVKIAVIEYARIFIEQPELLANPGTVSGLPRHVEALLYPLRDPAMA